MQNNLGYVSVPLSELTPQADVQFKSVAGNPVYVGNRNSGGTWNWVYDEKDESLALQSSPGDIVAMQVTNAGVVTWPENPDPPTLPPATAFYHFGGVLNTNAAAQYAAASAPSGQAAVGSLNQQAEFCTPVAGIVRRASYRTVAATSTTRIDIYKNGASAGYFMCTGTNGSSALAAPITFAAGDRIGLGHEPSTGVGGTDPTNSQFVVAYELT